MTSLQALTDEQLEQEIDWVEWELECQDDEERDATWYRRRQGLQGMQNRYYAEKQDRDARQEKLERLGSLSIESQDPAQLSLPL